MLLNIFWRISGKSTFLLNPKQQEKDIFEAINSFEFLNVIKSEFYTELIK